MRDRAWVPDVRKRILAPFSATSSRSYGGCYRACMKRLFWIALGVGAVALFMSRSKSTSSPSSPSATGSVIDSGIASWYGTFFNGRPTASGQIFDENKMTAAHRTMKLGTVVDVTNLENGRTVRVLVNDRGPFPKDASGRFTRVIDLSKGAARELDFVEKGLTRVEIRAVG